MQGRFQSMVVKSLQFRKWRIYQGLGGVKLSATSKFSGTFFDLGAGAELVSVLMQAGSVIITVKLNLGRVMAMAGG
jgi:hypothetical protein